jgi:U3 small nucleolar RNA-associated protein 15
MNECAYIKNPVLIKEHASIQSISFQLSKPHNFALCSSTRVQLYDATSLAPKKTISRFADVVYDCAMRRDGKLLLAGDATGLVQLFDLGSRAILRTLKGHGDAVRDVGFIGSGDSVYSGSDDTTARIWDVTSQTATSTLEGHNDYVCLYMNV